jgi:large exoprotein involved in heme utilization and adhesion
LQNRTLNSAAFSIVADNSTGNGGNIRVNTESLSVTNGALLSTSTFGQGRAGNINIDARGVFLNGKNSISEFSSGLYSATSTNASGRGGSISVNADTFQIANSAVVNAQTSSAFQGGDVTINSRNFEATQGGQVITTANNQGQAGSILLNSDSVVLSGIDTTYQPSRQDNTFENQGEKSGLFANTTNNASGQGGNIKVNARLLNMSNSAQVSVNSQGTNIPGNIDIISNRVNLTNGANIIAESESGDGGNINLTVSDLLFLRNGAKISTNAGTEQKGGDGGNININSKYIIAFPFEDSDISANAYSGTGGRVFIKSQGIFGMESRPKPTEKSDITASSEQGISGVTNINAPETDTIQNSLIELSQDAINTNNLIANSCISRGTKLQQNSFTVIGSGALPNNRPGDILVSNYTTGEVRGAVTSRSWKKGDAIIEPSGVYKLNNGQVLLSRECSN